MNQDTAMSLANNFNTAVLVGIAKELLTKSEDTKSVVKRLHYTMASLTVMAAISTQMGMALTDRAEYESIDATLAETFAKNVDKAAKNVSEIKLGMLLEVPHTNLHGKEDDEFRTSIAEQLKDAEFIKVVNVDKNEPMPELK